MQRPSLPTSLPHPSYAVTTFRAHGAYPSIAVPSGNHGYHTRGPTNSDVPSSHGGYSSHYAQALHQAQYAQAYLNEYRTPGMNQQGYPMPYPSHMGHASGSQSSTSTHFTSGVPANTSSWYTPGTCRCTYKGCSFVGSAKSLDIHRMDRHLIYPPGWKERKRKPDWDADPSLIGKQIPVQGTNVVLDTPEVIEAWIEERKKRWPSAQRVEEKKQKLEEAEARGQLDVLPSGFGGRKRRRVDEAIAHSGDGRRGRGHGGGHGRGRGRFSDGGVPGQLGGRSGFVGSLAREPPTREPGTSTLDAPVKPSALSLALPPKPSPQIVPQVVLRNTSSGMHMDDYSSSDDDEAPPEAVSSKPPAGLIDDDTSNSWGAPTSHAAPLVRVEHPARLAASAQNTLEPIRRPRPPEPRRLPQNPFAPRGSLLRNLLLPEIRMTVSNLSQAIRFLVDNDFLRHVELKPGSANERMIEVIEETLNDCPHVQPVA